MKVSIQLDKRVKSMKMTIKDGNKPTRTRVSYDDLEEGHIYFHSFTGIGRGSYFIVTDEESITYLDDGTSIEFSSMKGAIIHPVTQSELLINY